MRVPIPRLIDGRAAAVRWGLLALWSVLAGRLVYVQGISSSTLASQAQRQQISEDRLPARPGDIVDRQGRLLATSVQMPSLHVDPSRVKDRAALARSLSDALDLDEAPLAAQLERHRDKKFLWIKRRMSFVEAEAVRQLGLPAGVVGFRPEFQRHYPQGSIAAHVLGIRSIDNTGRGGIEESRDSELRGTDGVRRFVRDARGFVLDVLEEVTTPPQDGARITLSLDVLIQLIAERRLDRLMGEYAPLGACAVVLDPRTGEVLALASRPGFDPNEPVNVPAHAWKNLAISAVFEPGSTFKPFVVAWALDRGLIQEDEILDCEWGAYRMGRRVLHDHHRYGDLTLTDVLVKSSNIGMAKVGERLGNASLYDLAVQFGFGHPTGIELPGEIGGILHPLEKWTTYSTGSIPMGQELAATPLQVIAAHAVLANGGRRVPPRLILRQGNDEPAAALDAGLPLITELSSHWLVTGPLTEVVERGTGTKAKIEGWSVFGKTGTAQKTNITKKGYSQTRHISSFVCGAPSENPAVLVLVMVDEPTRGDSQFGGIVAAPAAADILRDTLHYLRVPQTVAE